MTRNARFFGSFFSFFRSLVAPFFCIWGFPGRKIPHCVAFECSSQAKTKQDPKLPKRQQFAVNDVHGFHAIERTSLLNDSRLCSEHYEDHCIYESYLLEARIVSFTGE